MNAYLTIQCLPQVLTLSASLSNLVLLIITLPPLFSYLFINVENRDLYLNVMFDAYWKDNLNISNEEIIKTLIKKSKIEPISFFDGINDPKIKEELKNLKN